MSSMLQESVFCSLILNLTLILVYISSDASVNYLVLKQKLLRQFFCISRTKHLLLDKPASTLRTMVKDHLLDNTLSSLSQSSHQESKHRHHLKRFFRMGSSK